MALLTAEDVLNKAFSKTKYREGFDQDEVDDFLDEVAQTISSLIAERDDLAQRLAQAQAGQPAVSAASVPAPAAEEPQSSSASLLQAATDPTPPAATGMLAMAQKLHDDYVAAGESERDRIIDEAKVKAESIVGQAEGDAQVRLDQLAAERTDLEAKIDDLRRFERDYRSRLKGYLENLLGDLDHATGDSAAAPVSAAPSVPAAEPAAPAAAAPTRTSFGANAGVVASQGSYRSAPSQVSAPSAASSVSADADAPAPSPWAQVRPQSAPSAPGAGNQEESTTPWGASQYTPRVEPRDQ
ncbi:DivIVA domain-containing protein [Demequina sediminicola]|uniref:DivIVA domain-containing protein n=1 Tax=Demequina sediminicola TaxID=1095026 RepID=UPI0009E52505|nr:DivIVA domain-containing protein [Demequina sediminicola]